MSKNNIVYSCSNCGAQSQKWNGRCLECGSWGTLEKEFIDHKELEKKEDENIPALTVQKLKDFSEKKQDKRIDTGISEINRVLGGGLMMGSLVLISGEPGIGKSTLLAQIADSIGRKQPVLYVSGEESAFQVKERLDRLNCDLENIGFLNEINVEKIIATAKKEKPALLILDSIQTVYSSDAPSEPGSVNQIRISTVKFMELAKKSEISVILVGHVTKDGQVAGPKTMEHMVDTVVYLETDKKQEYRILRATKNRFGSINELGVFEMTSQGFREIKNPSAIFLEAHEGMISGSAVSCIMDGNRTFLVEVQALVTKTIFGYPQRKASGYDVNRLQVLTAVLSKRADINLSSHDVILNVVGGMRASEPSTDLAVCAAIISSFKNKNIDPKTVFFGEVGLGGEVRSVSKADDRLKELERLGFKKVISSLGKIKKITGLEYSNIKSIVELVNLIK